MLPALWKWKKAPAFAIFKRSLVIVAALFFIQLRATAQDIQMEKLAPYFRTLITEQQPKDEKKKCGKRRAKKQKKMASTSKEETKYDVIVYTKNPAAIRAKGITVNSVLPTFVTAVATLDQVKLMAAMPDVTYVDAPGTDQLH